MVLKEANGMNDPCNKIRHFLCKIPIWVFLCRVNMKQTDGLERTQLPNKV